MTDHCPTCDSPNPKLHPAIQHEGEVSVCPDPWHPPVIDKLPDPTRAALVEALHGAKWCKWNDTLHAIAHDPEPEDTATLDRFLAQPAMARIKAVVDAAVAWNTPGYENEDFLALEGAIDHLLFGGHR